MEELIAQVAQKTGISAEHARTAVESVVTFLKSKLPAAVGSQLDQALSGEGSAGLADVASKALGGLFGKK